jgi:hypothetical protein
MFRFRSIASGSLRVVLLTALLTGAGMSHAGMGEMACDVATPLDLNGSLRLDVEGTSFLARLEVPAAGLLSVDAAVPVGAAGAARLAFEACGDSSPTSAVLDRSATHLVLGVTPGTYAFRVVPQDPRVPFTDLRLRTAFVGNVAEGPDGPQPKEGEDEEEIELEPNPVLHPGLGEGRSLHARMDALCRRSAVEDGRVDDHGDSFPCATLLHPGQTARGEISNGWGDDADVYRLPVGGAGDDRLWTLTLETTSGLDTVGTLYDRFGQPLQKVDGGGDFRIVRTLAPGTYFVRVESRDGHEGPYALRAEATAF